MKSPTCTLVAASAAACCATGVSAFIPSAARQSAQVIAAAARNRDYRTLCRPTTSPRHFMSSTAEDKEVDDDWAVIKPEEDTESWDLSLGGVGLAMDSAIRISGAASAASGGDADFTKMDRFNALAEASEADVNAAMSTTGAALIASGMGQELYKDPGLTTVREVTYAPVDAVVKALSSTPNAAALSGAKSIAVNFLGGNDLISGEAVDAANLLVQNMDFGPKNVKIVVNAVSYKDIPDGTASVTVMAVGGEGGSDDDASAAADGGLAEAIGKGEAYFYQGKWYAVLDEDLIS